MDEIAKELEGRLTAYYDMTIDQLERYWNWLNRKEEKNGTTSTP